MGLARNLFIMPGPYNKLTIFSILLSFGPRFSTESKGEQFLSHIFIKSYFCCHCYTVSENHVKKTNTKLINFWEILYSWNSLYIFLKINNSVYLKEEGLGSCRAHGCWVHPEPSNLWSDFLRTLENLGLGLSL